jgi:uncharacterized protein
MSALLVVDTNVVCTALLTKNTQAPPARLLDLMLAGHARHAVSLALLNEYESVLSRPGLQRAHGFSVADVETLVAGLARHAVLIQTLPSAVVAPDPVDQHLWDLLAADLRVCLVIGDKLLQNDASMAGRVISPADAVAGWQGWHLRRPVRLQTQTFKFFR